MTRDPYHVTACTSRDARDTSFSDTNYFNRNLVLMASFKLSPERNLNRWHGTAELSSQCVLKCKERERQWMLFNSLTKAEASSCQRPEKVSIGKDCCIQSLQSARCTECALMYCSTVMESTNAKRVLYSRLSSSRCTEQSTRRTDCCLVYCIPPPPP